MTTNEAVGVLEALDPQGDEFKLAIAMILRRVRQPYGATLFNALARLTVSEAAEVVLVRSADGELEVFMTQRASDDTAYPGEWHVPGSIFRPGEDEADVMARLSEREFGCQILDWEQIGHFRHMEVRGWFDAIVFLLDVDNGDVAGEPRNEHGAWYKVGKLPPNTCLHHRDRVIPMAVDIYRSWHD